ncbi:hypothetical protein EDB80DRAFT_681547 [Ilyonectria destructans]|nr:hypothetical protein EDB80DRAFT_681547 [Ilyonectria destructans]
MHGTYKAAVAGEGCRFLACPAVGRRMNPAFFFFLLRLFTTHSLDFSQLYFVLSPNRGGDEEAAGICLGSGGDELALPAGGPIAPGGRGPLGGCAKDGPGLQGTRALGSHSLASVANGCAWGETKDTRNMHDEKRCDAMQAVTAPLALPTLSSRALLCSVGEPATKHFVKQGSISITPGFERARRAARRKMNRPWILSHGLIAGPQLRASGPVVPRRPTAASGWLTGHPFRNFRYGQGLGPKSGLSIPPTASSFQGSPRFAMVPPTSPTHALPRESCQ